MKKKLFKPGLNEKRVCVLRNVGIILVGVLVLSLLVGEGVTYNYTIKTGSYPQIIHEHVFNTSDGEITCTEFGDANGKVYDDWIPVIRLE